MKIGDFDLDKDILIIAEVGNNHEGSCSLAEELIGLAAESGAGAVKFQTIVPDKLVSVRQQARVEQLRRFQLSYEQFERLSKIAKQEDILFLSTPFDMESARFLDPLVPAFKIASGDNTFYPLIDTIARTGKPIILSSGLADLGQIDQTRTFIEEIWHQQGIMQDLAILHCVTSYPVPFRDANLLAIRQLQKLGVTVGYSDHTIGLEASVLSVAMGARIIEKHFTISKDYSAFRDHALSADPEDLAMLVQRVKEALELLGDGQKRLQESEVEIVEMVRRSIVASRNLAKGTVISWDDLTWVRPGGGVAPGDESRLLGKILKRALEQGEMILQQDLGTVGGAG